MLSQILTTLQTMLIPLVIGLLAVGAAAVYFIGRPPTRPRRGPDTGVAPPDDAVTALAPDVGAATLPAPEAEAGVDAEVEATPLSVPVAGPAPPPLVGVGVRRTPGHR